ncbi:MAG: hypothetical protein HKO53_20345 [Gemmatimonadetes bacterium]|nr:hypothetical protein [Gemmatimonadota bacterium]
MIPSEYLVPYAVSNTVALVLLATAFRRPTWVRWASIVIFLWAAWTNARLALTDPLEYQGFAELALLDSYRRFILGWFRDHTTALVLSIAAGQLTIAVLMALNARWGLRLGVIGAVVFLSAIVPLGVGSALPFSLIYGAALVIMVRRISETQSTAHARPARS